MREIEREWQGDRQTDRQTDRQSQREREKERGRGREGETERQRGERERVYVVSVFVDSLVLTRTDVASGPSRHNRKRGGILLVTVPIFLKRYFRYFKSIYVVKVL
jgi:hypothetical protein